MVAFVVITELAEPIGFHPNPRSPPMSIALGDISANPRAGWNFGLDSSFGGSGCIPWCGWNVGVISSPSLQLFRIFRLPPDSCQRQIVDRVVFLITVPVFHLDVRSIIQEERSCDESVNKDIGPDALVV